jgi:hypothetical protein
MADLVGTYADLPLGATDAAVIALAERLGLTEVATLHHRHFTVVRLIVLSAQPRGAPRALEKAHGRAWCSAVGAGLLAVVISGCGAEPAGRAAIDLRHADLGQCCCAPEHGRSERAGGDRGRRHPRQQVFVPVVPPGARVHGVGAVGWARTDTGTSTVFSDKYGAVAIPGPRRDARRRRARRCLRGSFRRGRDHSRRRWAACDRAGPGLNPNTKSPPRDRAGNFDPRLVPMGARRAGGLDEFVLDGVKAWQARSLEELPDHLPRRPGREGPRRRHRAQPTSPSGSISTGSSTCSESCRG